MTGELTFLALLGVSLTTAVLHTLTGPDHYLPFIVLAKARKWSLKKTIFLTFVSGLGHIGSALLLALLFNAFQDKFAQWRGMVDETRGSLAAWLLMLLGLIYMVFGGIHLWHHHHHSHLHIHEDGSIHTHDHEHTLEHTHIHGDHNHRFLLGWSLFIIFVLGPCEALLPILAASAAVSTFCLFLSTLLFSIATIFTMLTAVVLGYYGTRFFNSPWLERSSHALAGFVIASCGFAMIFLGL